MHVRGLAISVFEMGTTGAQLVCPLTLFYMGFWMYVITWGDQNDPPYQNQSKQLKLGENACFGKNR